jgi:hypothetical protein
MYRNKENVFCFWKVWNVQLTRCPGRIQPKVSDRMHHHQCIQIRIFANKRDQHHSNSFRILDNTPGHFSPFSIRRNLAVYQLLCHRYFLTWNANICSSRRTFGPTYWSLTVITVACFASWVAQKTIFDWIIIITIFVVVLRSTSTPSKSRAGLTTYILRRLVYIK